MAICSRWIFRVLFYLDFWSNCWRVQCADYWISNQRPQVPNREIKKIDILYCTTLVGLRFAKRTKIENKIGDNTQSIVLQWFYVNTAFYSYVDFLAVRSIRFSHSESLLTTASLREFDSFLRAKVNFRKPKIIWFASAAWLRIFNEYSAHFLAS